MKPNFIMKFFKRKNKILDLTKRYEKQQARAEEMKQDMQDSSETNAGGLGFFGAIANTAAQNNSSGSSEYIDVSEVDERRRKLAKRLMEMTNKIEELSNQIYHLQQRIELLERKMNVN